MLFTNHKEIQFELPIYKTRFEVKRVIVILVFVSNPYLDITEPWNIYLVFYQFDSLYYPAPYEDILTENFCIVA